MLPRPFDGQITEARDPQAVRQMPIDRGFDEIGRKESQRYRHVDFAHAACRAVAMLPVVVAGSSTSSLSHRRPCAIAAISVGLRPNGTPVLLRWVSRQKNFDALRSAWCAQLFPVKSRA